MPGTSLSSGTRRPGGRRGSPSPPRRARRDGRHQGPSWYRCAGSSVVRMYRVPSLRDSAPGLSPPRVPVVTGLCTGFSHTVEFSRSLVGSPLRLSCGSLRRSVAGAAATLLWAFQVRQPSNLSPGSPGDPHRFARLSRTAGGRSHRVVRFLRCQRQVFPWYSPGIRCPSATGCGADNSGPSRVAQPRALGATSPPALQTETPSCALGLRTATASRGTFVLLALGDLLSSVLAPS